MNVKFCVKIPSNVNTPFWHFGWRDDRPKNAASGYIFIANVTKAQKCTANNLFSFSAARLDRQCSDHFRVNPTKTFLVFF